MPDFAPDYTCRYKVQYKAGGITHTFGMRVSRGTAAATIVAAGHGTAHDAFAHLASAGILYDDFEWLGAWYALQDSNVFVPIGTVPSTVTGTVDPATASAFARCTQISFPGRGAETKARAVAFGAYFDLSDPASVGADGIITDAEASWVGDFVAELSGGARVANDNTPVSYYPRCTINVNDFLLRQVRRGTIG